MVGRWRTIGWGLVSAVVFSLAGLACSDAQTPNAYYAAAVIPGDAGPIGERDQACTSTNGCFGDDLTCINDDVSPICRLECDVADNTDPCGVGQACRPLVNTTGGACLPAGALNDPCPCDEGFSCTRVGVGDGGTESVCRTSCEFVDGGPGDCPAGEGECRLFEGQETSGACTE